MFSSVLSVLGLGTTTGVKLAPVQVHDIETSPDKRSRRLKHLLKLNHAQYAILYNRLRFHNHSPHLYGSAYLLGASAGHLDTLYKDIADHDKLEPWAESPGEIPKDGCEYRQFLGKKEYQRAWVDFFDDEVAAQGQHDWRAVVAKYLFESGPKGGENEYPMFDCLIAGLGHPLIHLGYAFELNSRDVALEALGLAATCYDGRFGELLHAPAPKSKAQTAEVQVAPTSDLFAVFAALAADARLDGVFSEPGSTNLSRLLTEPDLVAILLQYLHAWRITDPTTQFAQSQHLAALLLTATAPKLCGHGFDFFIVHVLTTSHAVRILLPFLPPQHHVRLVREWLLIALAVYVSQLRPDLAAARRAVIDEGRLPDVPAGQEGDLWDHVAEKALGAKHGADAHYVKACRAMMVGARTWGEGEDRWFLKCAVKFADEFDGWGGFRAVEEEAEEVGRFAR